jgi:hypothetical protein
MGNEAPRVGHRGADCGILAPRRRGKMAVRCYFGTMPGRHSPRATMPLFLGTLGAYRHAEGNR